MITLSEQERNADFVNAVGSLFRCSLNFYTKPFQHIRCTALTGHAAVAVLGNLRPSCCNDEGRSGRNVEGVRAVAARSDNINCILAIGNGLCLCPHALCKSSDFFNGFALHSQSSEKFCNLNIGCRIAHNQIHGFHCFGCGQISAVQNLFCIWEQRFLRLLRCLLLGRNRNARQQVQESNQDFLSVFRQNGFRMELQAINRELGMFQCHNLPIFIPCGDSQASRQRCFFHNQGMIPTASNHWRQPCKQNRLIVNCNVACFAMHEVFCLDNLSAECLCNCLMS